MAALSLDPEPEGVPGAAEDAALLDRLHDDERDVGDRRARRRRDQDLADLLALGERRDQRVGALDLGLELPAFAFRDADVERAAGPQLGDVGGALPDLRRDDRLAVIEQADGV